MVVRTIEILLEYICLMLCLYNISKKKIKNNFEIVLLFFLDLIIMQAIAFGIVKQQFKLFVHFLIFLYTKKELQKSWSGAIKVYGIMLIILMALQIVGYYILRIFSINLIDKKFTGTLINLFACIIICIWTRKYKKLTKEKINSIKYVSIILIFLLILFRILYLCVRDNIVNFEIVVQFGLESIGLCVASMLWINSENEYKHKVKEIQIYELYNSAFEETIATMRIRQHEFENHINAIKCMRYTIDNHEQLAMAQEQYCNQILNDNELNKLLKINIDPILIGFIYSKIIPAKEKGIVVTYNISCRNVKRYIAIYELVELVGILFDNAVEAVINENKKIVILKLIELNETQFYIEIANSSRVYKNNEIEKFCKYGYSTKAQKRGVGLVRLKEITEKNKAELLIRNISHEDDNYLSFKISFGNLE